MKGPYNAGCDKNLLLTVVHTWMHQRLENILEISPEMKSTLPIKNLVFIPSKNEAYVIYPNIGEYTLDFVNDVERVTTSMESMNIVKNGAIFSRISELKTLP